MNGLKVDEEFRSFIPPLAGEERQTLEANLLSDGCRDPLVTWGGLLLDGHNRLEICTEHGINYRVKEIKLPSREDALLWIIDNQFGRRNLADIDRIKLAMKREDVVRPLANKSRKEGNSRGGKSSAKLPATSEATPIDTRAAVAKTAGVGERTYDAGKAIWQAYEAGEVSDEELGAIRRKEKSIHRVAKDLKERRQKATRDRQRKNAARKVRTNCEHVHVGDFRDLAEVVADGSLSLVFTDPPYDRKANELFDGIGKFAADKLADGGSLICYVGQTQIPYAIEGLREHLRYWWTVCCLHSGGANLMREYGVRCGWKAVLWFVKDTRGDREVIVSDVMSGGREKSHHDWQQAESEAAYWIEQLCPKDGIVCDPFLGGGTTAVAASRLGRKWIGFEKDKDQAALAVERITA